MANNFTPEIREVLGVGYSFENYGSLNWALNRLDALNATKILSGLCVGILGGDVWVKTGEKISQTYDNWFCEHEIGESNEAFLERSIIVAQNYISNYEYAGDGEILFEIVPEAQRTP